MGGIGPINYIWIIYLFICKTQ